MTPEELKACPFCGCASHQIIKCADDINFAILCAYWDGEGCGTRGPYRRSEGEAAEAWNARVNDAADKDVGPRILLTPNTVELSAGIFAEDTMRERLTLLEHAQKLASISSAEVGK